MLTLEAAVKPAEKPQPIVGWAAVISNPGQIRLEKIKFRAPGPFEIRVRLEGCGVCASNLPVWEGKPWFEYPFAAGAPGHEGWGHVDAVGQAVHGFNIGDRVSMLSSHAYAEFDVTTADELVKLPRQLNGISFPGEAFGCAMNIFRRAKISSGETVAIVGIGFLGALLTKLATEAGARVIAVSRRKWSRDIAIKLGASAAVSFEESSTLLSLTEQRGCDCVIEAVGNQSALDIATELTSERGRLVIAGYHQDGPRLVNMQLWNWRGLDVINAHERDKDIYLSGIVTAILAMEAGVIEPTSFVTHSFPLQKLDDAFRVMTERPDGFMKAVVTM